MRRYAMYIGIAFVIWFAIQNPLAAAHIVRNGGSAVSHATHSATTILGNLSGTRPGTRP